MWQAAVKLIPTGMRLDVTGSFHMGFSVLVSCLIVVLGMSDS